MLFSPFINRENMVSCLIQFNLRSTNSMADLMSNDQDGFSRYVSDTPPTHYVVKIQSLSLLAKNSLDSYESGEFEAGGYKWKIVFHPSGNKSRNVKDHVSIYLAMVDTDSLSSNWQVSAVFRLFLLDHNNDNYLVFQGKERRFHRLKKEWGFDQFVGLKAFTDASNGYVADDTCVIGAEVFVCREGNQGKGEWLFMSKEPIAYKNVWKLEGFSKLDAQSYDSKLFDAGDHKWKIQVYPKGKGSGVGSHVSVYVALAEPKALPPPCKIYADVTIRILDQVQSKHQSGKASHWFSKERPDVGGQRFVSIANLSAPNNSYVVRDACFVEAEITILGLAHPLP